MCIRDSDIAVNDDPYISRKQFVIKTVSDNGNQERTHYMITDCKSKNKTLLNGQALESDEAIFLKDGDIITAGKSTFEFRIF